MSVPGAVGQDAAIKLTAFAVNKLMSRLGTGPAGIFLQPVVWAVRGKGPDVGSAFIYAVGAVGAFAGSTLTAGATALVSAGKVALDEHIAGLVEEARLDEPLAVRNGIVNTGEFGFFADDNVLQAMQIAAAGGVAWQHPNGVYLYIRDARGDHICDYHPRRYKTLYRPFLEPPERNGKGVRWYKAA